MKKIFLFIILLLNSAKAADNIKVKNDTNNTLSKNNKSFVRIYDANYFDYHKNLLNSNNEIKLIKKIINIYQRNSNLINNKTESIGNPFNNYSQKAFVIYLKSILFISQDNWSIWLNDKKITNQNNKDSNEFYVKNISDNKIILQWNISEFKWSYVNKMNAISKDKFKILENGNVELILALHPNQSYLPFSDNIIEGKYQEENIIIRNKDEINNNSTDELDIESIISTL